MLCNRTFYHCELYVFLANNVFCFYTPGDILSLIFESRKSYIYLQNLVLLFKYQNIALFVVLNSLKDREYAQYADALSVHAAPCILQFMLYVTTFDKY